MKLDDPRAIDVLKEAVEAGHREKRARDERLAYLKPLHEEYLRLEAEQTGERVGRTSLSALRIQLSFALLYKEIGSSHLEEWEQAGDVLLPENGVKP